MCCIGSKNDDVEETCVDDEEEEALEPWMLEGDEDEDEDGEGVASEGEEEAGEGVDEDEIEFESRLISGEWSQEDLDRLVASLMDPRDLSSDRDLDGEENEVMSR